MAFVSEMVDQVRAFLDDPLDSQVSYATKRLYLNAGISMLWPSIWRIVTVNITILTLTYDYALAIAPSGGLITAVELQQEDGSYRRFTEYDIVAGDEDVAGVFRLAVNPDGTPYLGKIIRLSYAARVPTITASTYAAAAAETWTGPDRAINLPPLYAMGMITLRSLDRVLNATRVLPASDQRESGDASAILSGSRAWLDQFDLQLVANAMVLPVARD